MKIEKLDSMIVIPQGVSVKVDKGTVEIKGKYGEIKRKFIVKKINITLEANKLNVWALEATKNDKCEFYTLIAHLNNMVKGAQSGHKYALKICSSHFPMNVSVSGSEFIVKNFIGEKIPRKFTLSKGVKVKVEGSEVFVESADKEIAGQTAASIEQLAKRPGFDKRIFQDGIYITLKGGKIIK